MNIKVIKFGGSSISNDKNLKLAAKKTISFLKKGFKVVTILSAQGKTTNDLLNQAKILSKKPTKRELDALLSVGEQISIAKFAIILNDLGYSAVSLTGWQANITTDSDYTNAKILNIDTSRIYKELKNHNVVVIAGFQGISNNQDITTIGRNGSDTSALAITAALKQKECYIFTDTDGIYNKDPNKYTDAKKLNTISYDEMERLAKNGANVLHNRCIEIAKNYGIEIVVQSTFNNEKGSIVKK